MALRRLLFSLAAAAATVSSASAADMLPAPYIGQAPEVVPVEIGSGWYIRGDIGYAVKSSSPNFSYRTYDSGTNTYGSTPYDPSSSINANFNYGVGVGYTFNQFFRMDATIERTNGKFSGTSSSASPCSITGLAGTSCDMQDNATFAGWSALLNAYVEPGTFLGFTPYVGAGAGMTRVNWNDLSSAQYCVGGTCPTPPYAGTVTHGGEGDWRFTWALMAGLAYDITPHLKLDVGYRYRHIDGGAMYGWDATSATAGATGVQASDKGLATHEVRVGLRYSIW
jgi:opacity protein-like surface antigen